jgi:hypothetical protein
VVVLVSGDAFECITSAAHYLLSVQAILVLADFVSAHTNVDAGLQTYNASRHVSSINNPGMLQVAKIPSTGDLI